MEAADPTQIISCAQEGCTVELDGKCLEGFSDPKECPHFNVGRKESDRETVKSLSDSRPDDSQATSPTTEEQDKVDLITLFSGDPLSLEETRIITQARPTTLVTITGASRSGKTTLLGYLNDQFQVATSYGGYRFAGSYTLLALEERSHMARVASMRAEPDTPRTSFLEGTHCIHLRLTCLNGDDTITELLLADASGEYYEKAASDSERLQELISIQRAERVVLLLDGAKLADVVERQTVRRDADSMIRRCLENGIFNKDTILDVVLAKWDRIVEGRAEAFVGQVENTIKDRYEHRLGHLSFHRIAARSEVDSVEAGFGVEALFMSWFPARTPPASIPHQSVVKPGDREFDRLAERPLISKALL